MNNKIGPYASSMFRMTNWTKLPSCKSMNLFGYISSPHSAIFHVNTIPAKTFFKHASKMIVKRSNNIQFMTMLFDKPIIILVNRSKRNYDCFHHLFQLFHNSPHICNQAPVDVLKFRNIAPLDARNWEHDGTAALWYK